MKICAIDSSGLVASVAVVEDGITLAEYSLQHKITHSQTLLPMLNEIKGMLALELNSIDAYAVAAGPGSFTGLRIGAATVKGLGLVIDRPVVAVPTLEALAYNLYGVNDLVCPIMDARRQQVYTGVYSYKYNEKEHMYDMNIEMGQTACGFDQLCEKLNGLGKRVAFVGDGVPVFEKEMEKLLSVPYSLAPAHMNRQRAASLGALAYKYMSGNAVNLEGKVTTVDEMTPEYLRLSQAEREKKERLNEA